MTLKVRSYQFYLNSQKWEVGQKRRKKTNKELSSLVSLCMTRTWPQFLSILHFRSLEKRAVNSERQKLNRSEKNGFVHCRENKMLKIQDKTVLSCWAVSWKHFRATGMCLFDLKVPESTPTSASVHMYDTPGCGTQLIISRYGRQTDSRPIPHEAPNLVIHTQCLCSTHRLYKKCRCSFHFLQNEANVVLLLTFGIIVPWSEHSLCKPKTQGHFSAQHERI